MLFSHHLCVLATSEDVEDDDVNKGEESAASVAKRPNKLVSWIKTKYSQVMGSLKKKIRWNKNDNDAEDGSSTDENGQKTRGGKLANWWKNLRSKKKKQERDQVPDE